MKKNHIYRQPSAYSIDRLTNKDNKPLKIKVNQILLFNVFCHMDQYLAKSTSLLPIMQIQQWIVILIWVLLIHILDMHSEQMKPNHFLLDLINFNWMKLKSIKMDKKNI
jgi:hypothetical protein